MAAMLPGARPPPRPSANAASSSPPATPASPDSSRQGVQVFPTSALPTATKPDAPAAATIAPAAVAGGGGAQPKQELTHETAGARARSCMHASVCLPVRPSVRPSVFCLSAVCWSVSLSLCLSVRLALPHLVIFVCAVYLALTHPPMSSLALYLPLTSPRRFPFLRQFLVVNYSLTPALPHPLPHPLPHSPPPSLPSFPPWPPSLPCVRVYAGVCVYSMRVCVCIV